MSVHEYARRQERDERIERGIEELLARPTPPVTLADILEEHADLLVREAIQLRELAGVWREQERARQEAAA